MRSSTDTLERLADDPRYRRLVRRRGALSWALTAAMFITYFGFILLIAFAKPWLARPIAGGATSVGVPLGVGVILIAVLLTGYYVRRASREFDREIDALAAEFRQ